MDLVHLVVNFGKRGKDGGRKGGGRGEGGGGTNGLLIRSV